MIEYLVSLGYVLGGTGETFSSIAPGSTQAYTSNQYGYTGSHSQTGTSTNGGVTTTTIAGGGTTTTLATTTYSNSGETTYSNSPLTVTYYGTTYATISSGYAPTTTTTVGESFSACPTTFSSSSQVNSTSTSTWSGYTSTQLSTTYSATTFTQVSTTYSTTNVSSASITNYPGNSPVFGSVYQCNQLLEIIWAMTTPGIGFVTDLCKTFTEYTVLPYGNTYTVNVATSTAANSLTLGLSLATCSYTATTYASSTFSDGEGPYTDGYTTTIGTVVASTVDTNYLPARSTTSVSTITAYATTVSTFTVYNSYGTYIGSGIGTIGIPIIYNTTQSYTSFLNNGTTTSIVTVIGQVSSTGISTAAAPYYISYPGVTYAQTYIASSSAITGYSLVTSLANVTVHYQYVAQTVFVLPGASLNVSSNQAYLALSGPGIYYPFFLPFENMAQGVEVGAGNIPSPVYVPVIYPGLTTALQTSSTNSTGSTSITSWSYSWSSNTIYYTSSNDSTSGSGSYGVSGNGNAALSQIVRYASNEINNGWNVGVHSFCNIGGLQAPENQTFTVQLAQGFYKISVTHGTSSSTYTLNVGTAGSTFTAATSDNYCISGQPYITTGFVNAPSYITLNSSQQLYYERITRY